MKQIFITTSITSLQELFRETNFENPANSFNIPFTLTEVELSLHIVSDEIKFPSDFKIDKDKDGILFHDSSSDDVKRTITNSFNRSKGGSHVSRSLHESAFTILFGNENNKINRIIQLVFPSEDAILGKKLDLLHNLLVPPVDFTEAQKEWKELKKAVKTANDSGVKVTLSSDENALDVFVTESTGKKDVFDPAYLESLRTLRDKLLVS
jgi:hypothetical protein